MAATGLDQRALLAKDEDILRRVAVSFVAKAVDVAGEQTATPVRPASYWSKRQDYAMRVLEQAGTLTSDGVSSYPDLFRRITVVVCTQLTPAVVGSGGANINAADINPVVDAVWNKLAGVTALDDSVPAP